MKSELEIFNTLTKRKERFTPLVEGKVGMYVCGPTVYGDPHLGHARSTISFDLVYRYFLHLGNKVRYVRNITDVGHLENDEDSGEDKIAKKARIEELEPMEVAQYYTNRYHDTMRQLNSLPPSIEPYASGHIPEQIAMAETIEKNGFAYRVNGSLYFDVAKYNEKYPYGKLSGRKLEDLLQTTRDNLAKQDEKKNPFDFALWKEADPKHIMRWHSQWSEGFPGWHLECSVMSTKYLGEQFDIHGGGMDLMFPHHECEIAQSVAANGTEAVRYWMHNNMITVDGQKMGKSLGNFITLYEFFSGNHPRLEKAYSPMTIRFFILQAHYRSPLDFSNQALQSSEKGMSRLLQGWETLQNIQPTNKTMVSAEKWSEKLYTAINDDFNTPVLIAHLFDLVKDINKLKTGDLTIDESNLKQLQKLFSDFVFDVLGLKSDAPETEGENDITADLIDLLLNIRKEMKANKMYELSDQIRNRLQEKGVVIKDTKDGFEWEIKN
ncbi:MAG: cysteine--tRNA ligase [Bacteroidales bacterium]|nr:cysteine--tRNA ligase [Bacteroidales bacterium]